MPNSAVESFSLETQQCLEATCLGWRLAAAGLLLVRLQCCSCLERNPQACRLQVNLCHIAPIFQGLLQSTGVCARVFLPTDFKVIGRRFWQVGIDWNWENWRKESLRATEHLPRPLGTLGSVFWACDFSWDNCSDGWMLACFQTRWHKYCDNVCVLINWVTY